MMRIALDMMGGDHAPQEIVRGAVEASIRLKEIDRLLLVGDESVVRDELARWPKAVGSRLEIVHAAESIGMDESPVTAVRKKKLCSINICMDLLKRKQADAMVSAGNSGAVTAAAVLNLGRVPGVLRPAIATVMPTRQPKRPLLLLDAGANTDCDGAWLAQFAVMGSIYSRYALKRTEPVVGLLSIGTEDCKGNEMTKKAFSLIQKTGVKFRGNVEGHDLFLGKTDVVVCDGFVGNVVLKTTESVAHAVGYWMKREFFRHPVRMFGALLLKGALETLKHRMDPEIYGGAPLLGVPGTVIITHGSSTYRAIYHAIIAGTAAASGNVSAEIADKIGALEAAGAGNA
ncbi:MAG: phosphate acyltransferase PlsX [Kiritimatiellae bacterium]|nr:phosphate acyltransferase PlsX [Kiritimatiellia bacterium]MDD3543923.1 phosphate acyltransferase PlsX [Kiritimatiellia bacterium]